MWSYSLEEHTKHSWPNNAESTSHCRFTSFPLTSEKNTIAKLSQPITLRFRRRIINPKTPVTAAPGKRLLKRNLSMPKEGGLLCLHPTSAAIAFRYYTTRLL